MKSEKLFSLTNTGDSIRIYFETKWTFYLFNFNINERLLIEIPEAFNGNLDAGTSSGGVTCEDEFALGDVKLHSSSGGIRINGNLTANHVSVKTSSGGINAKGNITSKEEVRLKTSSGGIKLEGSVAVSKLDARTLSGGIRLASAEVESYYLHSSSGAIRAESISGTGEAETSSGGIQLSLAKPKGDVKLTASSGTIKITLEPDLQFTLDAQVSSGSIHTNFDANKSDNGKKETATIGENPVVNITARTSSGGIRAEKQ